MPSERPSVGLSPALTEVGSVGYAWSVISEVFHHFIDELTGRRNRGCDQAEGL